MAGVTAKRLALAAIQGTESATREMVENIQGLYGKAVWSPDGKRKLLKSTWYTSPYRGVTGKLLKRRAPGSCDNRTLAEAERQMRNGVPWRVVMGDLGLLSGYRTFYYSCDCGFECAVEDTDPINEFCDDCGMELEPA